MFRTWVNTPWSLQNISCRPLLQDSENNTQEAFHGELNTFPLVGSEWKYISRRRLMLCAVFLDAVFLHTADAAPHTAGYWAQMCWSLWVLTSCAFLLWKGLTRVKGQNTASERVLNFRTGDHEKKNSPWKDFIFLLKSKETELYGNASEVYTQNTATSCTKLKLLIFKDSAIFLSKFESCIWTRLHVLYSHHILMHRVNRWATLLRAGC